MTDVIYLYGFLPSGTHPPSDLRGVADRPVEVVELGAFAAAIGRVPAERYEAEAVRPKLTDLDWVAEQGLRHEGVINRFVDATTILPARLLTLYSSLERLARDVEARDATIRAELARLRGRREWDLKVSYDADEIAARLPELSDEVAELDARIDAAAPGTRYLLERKRARILHEESVASARRLARELLDALRPRTDAARLLEAPTDAADLPVVLNAALLVPEDQEAALRSDVEARTPDLEAVGLRVAFSGPWAPYRFMEGSDEDGPDHPRAG